jgi:hypothetical protein
MAYSNAATDKLYGLLPSYVRERDAAEGHPLRALLRVIETQADRIEADIEQLANDAFVETAEPWAIPYIGDLVGTTPIFDESRVAVYDGFVERFPDLRGPSFKPRIGLSNRADVARTIYYRRRKGTAPLLEELARDSTGWSARAVEFFELLGWTQWVRNHLRPHAPGTPDLRSVEAADRLDGPFDRYPHTVDVREISQHDGWWNIRNIGFFLFRLRAQRLERATARPRTDVPGGWAFTFSPLGNSAPLFSAARREGDAAGQADERHVPQPIRPARFWTELVAAHADPVGAPAGYYGAFSADGGAAAADEPSLEVRVDGAFIPRERVVCRELRTWTQAAGDAIGIDVARGRLVLGPALVPASRVEVSHHFGFPADLGGGAYRRRAWAIRRDLPDMVVLPVNDGGAPGAFATIAAALSDWAAQGRPNCVIRVEDSRSYAEALSVEPADGRFLAIEAADGQRPHLRLSGPLTIAGAHEDARVTLSGLLIEGRIEIAGSLGLLRLLHTTLVPGVSIAEDAPPASVEPAIRAAATDAQGQAINGELRVELAFSIVGPVRMPAGAEGLFGFDSIIDGVGAPAVTGPDAEDEAGPPMHVERCTLRGATLVREVLLGSECIFDGVVTAQRVQTGCLRFSYVPPGSRAPRRYRCQPGLAIRAEIARREAAAGGPLDAATKTLIRDRVGRRVRPEYASEDYGRPAYLQLSLKSAPEIATGAEDGAEMGVYRHLQQPQREANLRLRLEEYLPFGLDAGLIYAT